MKEAKVEKRTRRHVSIGDDLYLKVKIESTITGEDNGLIIEKALTAYFKEKEEAN